MAKRYHEDMMMDDIMRQWPATIRVILRHHLLCIGCPVASFHTVEDAIREHEIDGVQFRREHFPEIVRSNRQRGRRSCE